MIFSSYVNGTTFQLALKNSEVAFNVPKSFVDIQYLLCRIFQRSFDDLKAQVLSEEGRIPMTKVTEDGEIIDYGWYKEIHTDGPIKYDTPQYAFEEPVGEKVKGSQGSSSRRQGQTRTLRCMSWFL